MKFGELSVAEAEGAILAHSQKLGRNTLKKGRVLSAGDVADLAGSGVDSVMAAQMEAGDIGEDEAAGQIADAVTGAHATASAPFTGRVNLHADTRGLVAVDRMRLNRVNQVDEAITIAVVPPFEFVEAKQTIATIKIIPFAISSATCNAATEVARGQPVDEPLVRIVPFMPQQVGLIQTRLSGTKESVLDKTTDVTAARLQTLGSKISIEVRCDHCGDSVTAAIVDMQRQDMDIILISGASAITDRRDIIPAAVVDAGGVIDHFGMPVDPGNLLLLAHVGSAHVIGLPGCARSPKFNGFDWVLQRLAARLAVTPADIIAMGSGGLLTDISTRPLPRSKIDKATARPGTPAIAAVVLAAGQSRRMGQVNKLLAEIGGQPMVTRVVDAALASKSTSVYVIVGHEGEKVRSAVAGRQVTFVENPDYEAGLSASLKHGIAALLENIDGAVICLGDMPRVTAAEIDRLIDAFDPLEGRAICLPTYDRKRGNPVLWARRFFREMQDIKGDVGARHLLRIYEDLVIEVEMAGKGVLLDIDTPQALADAKA
jgi:molybdenum cofactor cytidylyltransferase